MNSFIDKRKHKEDKPVIAICYDFDKTLSPDDMQAQGYIQSVGYDDAKLFWTESNDLATDNDMDQNLAYMFKMMEKARGRLLFTRRTLEEQGEKVVLFPGVEEWFERIRKYGEERGVIIEHYIISSGLKEMIEGTSVAKKGVFEKIYASSFYYDQDGVALWPAQVVNYTNKTQFLFRIEKGILDINDPGVNERFAPDEIRVPFRNMIYLGDSDTDIPCMKLITVNGGYSIAVYNSEMHDKTKAYKMMREGRVKYFAPADYSEGKDLDCLVKAIIDRTVSNEKLEKILLEQKREQEVNDKGQSAEKIKREDLIVSLSNSRSFAYTHSIIADLKKQSGWTQENRESLFSIALNNSQVLSILKDTDVKQFYQSLLDETKSFNDDAKKIKEILSEYD